MSRSPSELGFRRWAALLFDQQMWCFGRDIVRSQGNVLVDLGMCRYRPCDPNGGSTVYTAAVERGGSIFLWGFGAMYAEANVGGVFVRRYDFAPRLTARASGLGVHRPEALGRLTNPYSGRERELVRRLLPNLIGWFARYEHGIAESFGTAYRADCLRGRTKESVVAAKDMAAAWERAAKRPGRLTAAGPTPGKPWNGILDRLRANSGGRDSPPSRYRPPVRVNRND